MFSTQVGCPIRCKICSAGKFVRNLTSGELANQCSLIKSNIELGCKPLLLSAMGVGEPTCNWENVVNALNIFNGKSQDINTNKFAISTMIPDVNNFKKMLNKFKELGLKIKIQISVHSLKEDVREMIFNGNCYSSFNVKDMGLFAAVNFEVEYNYVLIDGVNDSEDDANKLVSLYYKTDIPIKINEFHPCHGFNISVKTRRDMFVDILRKGSVRFEEYSTDGVDINGACGQLVGGLYS